MTHSLSTLIQQTYDSALKNGDLLFFEAEHAVKDSNGIKVTWIATRDGGIHVLIVSSTTLV